VILRENSQTTTTANKRYRAAKKATLVGALVNLLLGSLKIAVGFIGHSHALIADGLHSFSDLLTDALVVWASRFGSEKADKEHPYGHGRIETAFTVGLAVLLTAVGAGIVWDATWDIATATSKSPLSYWVLVAAGISVLANEALYHYTLRVANKVASNLLKANAWHHRSDAASSIVVLIGASGAMLNIPYLDALAAIIVGILIIRMGISLGWSNICELIDTAVDEQTLRQIKEMITTTPGVNTLHQLRTRSMAGNILLDVHILVDPFLSVSEGHFIGDQVRLRLHQQFQSIRDITIHIDPEDDEKYPPSLYLPSRAEVVQQLAENWKAILPAEYINHLHLHYLAGQIHIEVWIKHSFSYQSDKSLEQQLQENTSLTCIKTITCLKGFDT